MLLYERTKLTLTEASVVPRDFAVWHARLLEEQLRVHVERQERRVAVGDGRAEQPAAVADQWVARAPPSAAEPTALLRTTAADELKETGAVTTEFDVLHVRKLPDFGCALRIEWFTWAGSR